MRCACWAEITEAPKQQPRSLDVEGSRETAVPDVDGMSIIMPTGPTCMGLALSSSRGFWHRSWGAVTEGVQTASRALTRHRTGEAGPCILAGWTPVGRA